MKISVIIPVYNGAKYLKKLIQNLCSVNIPDFELILVDDGSEDNSFEICSEYALRDNRIIVVKKDNGGICSARNKGLSIAKGEYIAFVDQDDCVNAEAYKLLVNSMKNNVDMVIAGKQMAIISKDNIIIENVLYSYDEKMIIGDNDILDVILNRKGDLLALHIWNCLYRKSIIDKYNIRFNENFKYGHEDSLFNVEYICKCNSIFVVKDIVYKYFRREKSSTSLRYNQNYLNDFELYCEIASNNIKKRWKDKKSIDLLYSYLFRLGVSLYSQYGVKSVNKHNDMNKVYSICEKYCEDGKITFNAVYQFKVTVFYKLLDFFIRKKKFGLAEFSINKFKR